MEMSVFWILFCIVHTNMAESQVTVGYLHGGRRSSSAYYDYFFCCNTKGDRLEWRVNGDSVGGFVETDSGSVVAATHSNYFYISSLLSVEEIEGVYHFDSIIVITLASPDILNISCQSNLGSNSTNNMMPNDFRRNGTNLGTRIEQLFSGQVIPSTRSMTYGFLCRGQEAYQTWAVDNQQDQLAFADDNNVGFALPIVSNSNPVTLYRLAFIFEAEPNEIVSMLFVTGNLGINVTCSGAHGYVSLLAANLSAQTTTTTAHMPTTSSVSPVTKTSSSMMPTPLKEVDILSGPLRLVIGIVVGLVALIIIVAVVSTIIFAQKHRKGKISDVKENKENMF